MKKHFLRVLGIILTCVLMTASSMPAFAAWDGFSQESDIVLVDASNLTKIFNSGAVPATKSGLPGRFGARWKNHQNTTYIRFNTVERDWSACNVFEFDIYSEKATNAKLVFNVYADYVPMPGKTISYFSYAFTINWTGVKHFKLTPDNFQVANYADWAAINYVDFVANGWGCTPDPDSDITISSVVGHYDVNEESDGYVAMESMDVSENDKQDIYDILKGSTAVMDFAANCITKGKIQQLDIEDKITTNDDISFASTSFFKNVLGANVKTESDNITIDINGSSIELCVNSQQYISGQHTGNLSSAVYHDGENIYVPLCDTLNAMGIAAKTYKKVTIIGDSDAVFQYLEDSKKAEKDLLKMLNVVEKPSTNISKADWRKIKDNWRRYLVGDESTNIDDPYVKEKLAKIDSTCDATLGIFNKNSQILALFGSTPCTESADMTFQYTYLYNLVEAYGTYGSKYYKDQSLKRDILFCLNWFYENLYGQDEIDGKGWRNPLEYNWWDWYCGSAQKLCDSLIIMEDSLNPKLIKKYLSLYNYLRPYMRSEQEFAHASSRVYCGTATAVLEEDSERMERMKNDYNMILAPVDKGDGVQEDDLYITHKYFAYGTSYGTSTLLERLTRVQCILADTVYEFATPYKYNTCKWLYETFAPITFNGYMTGAQSGRTKLDEDYYLPYVIGGAIDLIGVFGKDDDIKLKQLIKRNVRDSNINKVVQSLSTNQVVKLREVLTDDTISAEPYYKSKLYYTGDSVMHQRDDFGFALSMSSSRIAGWESINGVNQTGWYQGDGMLYTYLDTQPNSYGLAYWQNVNPYHLPGTTVDTQERTPASIADPAEVLTNQDFVGGAEYDDLYSVSAMQLESYHNDNENASVVTATNSAGGDAPYHQCSLMAKKSYFMFDDELLAMGCDINANDGYEVQTVVDNRMLYKTESVPQEAIEAANAEAYKVISVSSSGDDGNVAANTIDGDYTTRWSQEGSAWVVYELADAMPIGYAGIAQYGGINGKQAIFKLEASLDGQNFTTVWEGKASGTTENMEPYDMKNTVAKYIRYTGMGRTNSGWNSVTEIKFYAPREDGSMVVDSAGDSNTIFGAETILVDGSPLEKKTTYSTSFTNPKWMHVQDYCGYYFPKGGELYIDKVYNKVPFLETWLSHGVSPVKGSYSYVVLPKKTAEQTAAYAENPDVEIISNTDALQAAKEKSLNITGMVFWEAGTCEDITVSQPLILMCGRSDETYQLKISDPTKKLESAVVTVDGLYKVSESDSRCSVTTSNGKTIISANLEGSKGRTLSVKLIAQ